MPSRPLFDSGSKGRCADLSQLSGAAQRSGNTMEEIKMQIGLPSTFAYNQMLVAMVGLEADHTLLKQRPIKEGVANFKNMMDTVWKENPAT
eukprot:6231446-Karenia_brevis.AAC.1